MVRVGLKGNEHMGKPVDNRKKIEKNIKETISRILDIDIKEVNDKLHIDNTPNWTSLNHLRLMVEIETQFGVFLNPAKISHMIDYTTIVNTLLDGS